MGDWQGQAQVGLETAPIWETGKGRRISLLSHCADPSESAILETVQENHTITYEHGF